MWDLNAGALGAAAAEAGASDSQAVDIAAEEAVDAATQRSIDALGGRLDILVASAGITGPNGALKDYTANDWRKVFDVNVNGVFYCNRAAVRAMDRAGYGRIVNVASVAGKEGNPNASAYSASKAAVIALTKSLGKESVLPDIGETRLMMVTFPPDSVMMSSDFDPAAAGAEYMARLPGLAERFEPESPGMHTTDTVDYGVLTEGEISLELDDGKVVALKPGDVVCRTGRGMPGETV